MMLYERIACNWSTIFVDSCKRDNIDPLGKFRLVYNNPWIHVLTEDGKFVMYEDCVDGLRKLRSSPGHFRRVK